MQILITGDDGILSDGYVLMRAVYREKLRIDWSLPPVLALLLFSHSVASSQTIDAGTFLQQLDGVWSGRAIQTPVGPTGYDIEFKSLNTGCVSGTTDTGVSLHTWTFCESAGKLQLRFLSDFRGNTQGIVFDVVGVNEEVVIFVADTHKFMRLLIDRFGSKRLIKVFHHGELHVEIELNKQLD